MRQAPGSACRSSPASCSHGGFAVGASRTYPVVPSSNALIRPLHHLHPINLFQPPNDEVPAGHILKMIDEERVDHRAAGRTENRNGLRGGLF